MKLDGFDRPSPSNYRFEIRDMNGDLSDYNNSFDVVHVRTACQGSQDFRLFLNQVANMLRPGGILLSVEGDVRLCNAKREFIVARNQGDPVRENNPHPTIPLIAFVL